MVAAAVAGAGGPADRVCDRAAARARRACAGGGLKVGGAPLGPVDLPGVLLAALATLGLGLVLGPEAPLIALGTGLGILAMSLVRRDAPQQALAVMAAAGSFAAVASIFGSPVIGAVLIIEATGLGGPTLPVVLLPGLMAAGIGSLVFIGLGSWSGFSTAAWSLSPFPLPAYGGPGWGDFGWTVVLAVGAAVVTFGVMELARLVLRVVRTTDVRADDRRGARRRRPRDRLRGGDGLRAERGALLGRARVLARCSPPQRRSRCPRWRS